MKTNLLFKIVIALIITFSVMYAMVSFINWELNPKEWTEDTRAGISFMTLIFSCISCAITAVNHHEIKKASHQGK